MKLLALFSIMACLVSCQSQPAYDSPFQEEDLLRIMKLFGPSKTYLPGIKRQFYEGLLLGLADNADIYAMTDGIVASVCVSCERSVLGNHIVVLDEDGSEITYYHLSRVSVDEGARVLKGQNIATSGNSGMTTMKNGLGISIKSGGKFIDPRYCIPGIT